MSQNDKLNYIRQYGIPEEEDASVNSPHMVDELYHLVRQRRMVARMAVEYFQALQKQTKSSDSLSRIRRAEADFNEYALPHLKDKTVEEVDLLALEAAMHSFGAR